MTLRIDTPAAYSLLFAELGRIEAAYSTYRVDLGEVSLDDMLVKREKTPEEQRRDEEWKASEEYRKRLIVTEREDFIIRFRELTKQEGPVIPPGASFAPRPGYPYLSSIREPVRLLVKHAELAAQAGDYDTAAEDILAGLRYSDALALDDSLTLQLTRIAITGMVVEGVTTSLGSGALPSDAMFSLLMTQAANSASLNRFSAVVTTVATHYHELFDISRAGNGSQLRDLYVASDWGQRIGKGLRGEAYHPERIEVKDFTREALTKFYTSPMGRPWVDRDERILTEAMTKASALVDLPYSDAQVSLQQLEASMPRLLCPLFSPVTPVGRALTARANGVAQLDLMRLGLSLERYHAKEGTYPGTLDAVASLLEAEVPKDPFMGESYHYEPRGDSFVLYSVGQDLEDDGGRHEWKYGDVVWRGS
ncbi:MAG: hypothetical protein IT365_12965 [Candidatus Hydrogenedentes bacterium]|nr:hypothetical protein [Candidatus Hydrogenedentota bacterium]